MIAVSNVAVSPELIENKFVCHLEKCKGACCVEGNSGAPLEEAELQILREEYPAIKPFLAATGIAAIEQDGLFVIDQEGDHTTTCVDGDKECAYMTWENGITQCGIEQAWKAGKTSFRKPISCHLYPIRTVKYPEFDVLRYDRWGICSSACSHGEALQVPVYQFLREALIRKYGEAWYAELEQQVDLYRSEG